MTQAQAGKTPPQDSEFWRSDMVSDEIHKLFNWRALNEETIYCIDTGRVKEVKKTNDMMKSSPSVNALGVHV